MPKGVPSKINAANAAKIAEHWWTDERVQTLRAQASRLRAREIADLLGTTRSAVIAKAKRLKVSLTAAGAVYNRQRAEREAQTRAAKAVRLQQQQARNREKAQAIRAQIEQLQIKLQSLDCGEESRVSHETVAPIISAEAMEPAE